MRISIERAIEILNPEHREHYESIDLVNEACRMGMEALKNPLLAFIKQEVPFRLEEVLEVPEGSRTFEIIEECVDCLYESSDVMFDYDALDSFLTGILDEHGIKRGEEQVR